MFDATREALRELGLPGGDCLELSRSRLKFPDGGDFKIEIPTVNSPDCLNAILIESQQLKIKINRITETFGIFRHTSQEIKEMVAMCRDTHTEYVMSIGPRATYDTSATVAHSQGKAIAYRLRGQEQVVRAIEDIKRAIDLGVTNFLVYDEGLLWVLNQMRSKGQLLTTIQFKVSAHCGHANPASLKLLQTLGANSINPVRDLSLPMIAALRQAVDIPLDCHTDNPASSGGFIRFYEVPEMVHVAAPIYLKTGNSISQKHGRVIHPQDAVKMVRQASIVLEMLDKYCPEMKQSDL